GSSRGILIIFVGLIAGAALYGNTYFKAGEQKNQRKESMIRDYPYIVSKLVLLLGAGLSMRHAFDQIRRDYQSSLRQGGQTRAGYEEIGRMCADMDQGIPEEEAYRRLGQRCDLALYRTFSVLLVQNLKRGSQEVIDLFVREAENAFEERKKRARIQGEKASARLLMPTILMLGVVMVILMVPAFLTM
ncbi:MAG: type II secretion system F family protein, partial [Lachnospiraceae bacterium]|nr:type II secretion system F family protein [Candidatus Equihabitans merdae]